MGIKDKCSSTICAQIPTKVDAVRAGSPCGFALTGRAGRDLTHRARSPSCSQCDNRAKCGGASLEPGLSELSSLRANVLKFNVSVVSATYHLRRRGRLPYLLSWAVGRRQQETLP